jgi:hypothetical protein
MGWFGADSEPVTARGRSARWCHDDLQAPAAQERGRLADEADSTYGDADRGGDGPGQRGRDSGECALAGMPHRISGDGIIAGASHPDAVLLFLRSGQPWDDDVMTTFCHYVLHFTSPATARRWTAGHPGTFVISLDAAVELARRHAARTFGPALA